MPIRPEFRHLYRTPLWAELRRRRLHKARNRCEQCGRPDRAIVFTYTWQSRPAVWGSARQYFMAWCAIGGKNWREQHGRQLCLLFRREKGKREGPRGLPRKIRVVLAVTHVDQNPHNMSYRNLRVLCGWCHLHVDKDAHKETRARRRDAARPVLREATA